MRTPADATEITNAGETRNSAWRNPALAEGRRDFPQYQWDEQGEEAKRHFTGVKEPERLGEQRKGKRNTVWKYTSELYPALMWYWNNIRWESGQGKEISWAEVALDFQAATHTGLAREEREWNEETLRTRAKIMAASSRRIAHLCQEDIAPGGKNSLRTWVSTLQGLGFARVRGIQARPIMIKRDFVQQVLLQEAVRAATNDTIPNLDFVPDMAGAGEPKWAQEDSWKILETDRRESGGEQKCGKTLKGPTKIAGGAKMQRRRLTASRALAVVQWTEEEKTLIAEVKGNRNQGREKV